MRCPWEERERLGALAAFGDTLQRSLFRPADFFREMPPGGRVGSALLYAVIIGTLSAAVAMMWQRAIGYPDALMKADWHIPPLADYVWYTGLAFLPLLIVMSTVFRAAVLHFSLTFLGGARGDYSSTLKVVSYATSASSFNVFPFVGSPIAFLWRVALLVIGLRETHRISTGRAFVAWLLPFLAMACLVAAILFALLLGLMKFLPALGDVIAV